MHMAIDQPSVSTETCPLENGMLLGVFSLQRILGMTEGTTSPKQILLPGFSNNFFVKTTPQGNEPPPLVLSGFIGLNHPSHRSEEAAMGKKYKKLVLSCDVFHLGIAYKIVLKFIKHCNI
jgi:hypothetical protein